MLLVLQIHLSRRDLITLFTRTHSRSLTLPGRRRRPMLLRLGHPRDPKEDLLKAWLAQ